MDPLSRLGRTDKWFLGGGSGAISAPIFPRFLRAPGYWDEVYLADVRIPRLFTAVFLDADGAPLRFESYVKGWRPDRLTLMHYAGDVVIREIRAVTSGNAWVSEFELVTAVRPLDVFLWTLHDATSQPNGTPAQSVTDVEVTPEWIGLRIDTAWPTELEPDRTGVDRERLSGSTSLGKPVPVFLHFGANAERQSLSADLVQRQDESPLYELSMLPAKFRNGHLPNEVSAGSAIDRRDGMLHTLQHYRLTDRKPLIFACGSGLNPRVAGKSLHDALRETVIEESQSDWRAYFDSVPQFESDSEALNQAYWYRWYGLRLNSVRMPELPISGSDGHFQPFVTEGVGFFRNFVTYSAQAHLREATWMHSPELAVGILDNLAEIQRDDGSFPGHNYSGRPSRDFYHADFATGLRQLHRLHPGAVRPDHLATMRRYADYMLRQRTMSADPAGPTLYDIFDQNETGQEYMSRYDFANQSADEWATFRVSGVDATVYAHRLFAMLAEFRPVDSVYRRFAEGAIAGLWNLAFDADAAYFCDVDRDGVRSGARPATGLYALEDLSESKDRHEVLDRVWTKWLANPDEFWGPAGFPATAFSDDTFSAIGEWRGRRLNCPWNGRSWPMANSHLVDAAARFARSYANGSRREELRNAAGAAVLKGVELMFHRRNWNRPCSYEHYDPLAGTPALYRGYDDTMHSWIVDLILRHVVGVVPGQCAVDPLPIPGVSRVECGNLPHPDGRMHVRGAAVEIEPTRP